MQREPPRGQPATLLQIGATPAAPTDVTLAPTRARVRRAAARGPDARSGAPAGTKRGSGDWEIGYPTLRAAWQVEHPDVPDAAYPSAADLRRKFSFGWNTFKVAGAANATAIDDIEAELAGRQIRSEQLNQMKQSLRAECQQFASDYVMAFRQEVAEFCDQVIDAGGKVHGKTLQAIRRKIEHFHAMNIFNDADTAAQLNELKNQIFGLTGETLKEQPDLAAKLSEACAVLKKELLDPSSVPTLTGRLKRRVVLE